MLPNKPDVRKVSPREAVELVDEALTDSVREALVADVPGTYLSGGVDSSLITALAARERHGGALRTFSAGFGDARLDETSWARKVAGIIGSTHHEVRGNSRLLPADLVEVELASGRAAVRARRSRGFSPCSDGARASQSRAVR